MSTLLDSNIRNIILDDREMTQQEELMLDGLDRQNVVDRYDRILVEMRMTLYGIIWKKSSDYAKVISIITTAETLFSNGNFQSGENIPADLSFYIKRLNAVLDFVCKPQLSVEDYPAILLFLSRSKTKLETFLTLGEI